MPRKTRGHGGKPIPGSETSEEVEVGFMGDHTEDRKLQFLETIANGKQASVGCGA
jgi:hypothetical protein